jgi:pyrroloquinoline quinone biosynthesis protein D
MSEAGKSTRILIGLACKPAFARHARLRRDAARERWTILAPERVFLPDPIAVAVLQLCDGRRTVDDIAEVLARSYDAPKAQILTDVIAMLQRLADKGVVTA